MLLEAKFVGEVQAGPCFIKSDLQLDHFFQLVTASKEPKTFQIWRMTSQETNVEKLMLGHEPFLAPESLLNQVPKRYLIEETTTLLRLKLPKGDVPVLFPYYNKYSLLKNSKVSDRIMSELKKKKRPFRMYLNEKEKKLCVVNEISFTLDELIQAWSTWTDIFKGYFPLVVPYEESMETGLVMTITEGCIAPRKNLEGIIFDDLALSVMKTLYPNIFKK